MKSKFWIVLSSCMVVLVLVGLFGSGDAVQAAGAPRLSIPAAAFTPWKHEGAIGAKYENHGRFLKHLGPEAVGTLGSYWYVAPVYLPDGVTVTKVTAHWYQESPAALGQFKLQRSKFGTAPWVDMAVFDSGATSGYGSTSTATINQAVVDNSLYTYWVLFYIPASLGTSPGSNVWGCGAQIEYSGGVFLPAIAK
jgi:hypothetical protein